MTSFEDSNNDDIDFSFFFLPCQSTAAIPCRKLQIVCTACFTQHLFDYIRLVLCPKLTSINCFGFGGNYSCLDCISLLTCRQMLHHCKSIVISYNLKETWQQRVIENKLKFVLVRLLWWRLRLYICYYRMHCVILQQKERHINSQGSCYSCTVGLSNTQSWLCYNWQRRIEWIVSAGTETTGSRNKSKRSMKEVLQFGLQVVTFFFRKLRKMLHFNQTCGRSVKCVANMWVILFV